MPEADVEALIPFLQQLVKRLKTFPAPEEIQLLQKATFKEMRPYFDALASGREDAEVFKMIVAYMRDPSKGTGLNNPQLSPRGAAPAAPKHQPSPQAAAAPSNSGQRQSKPQVRKIMDGTELHVIEEGDGAKFVFELRTKGTNDMTTIAIDFSDSMGLTLTPEGPATKTANASAITVNIPTTAHTEGKELCCVVATLTADPSKKNVSLNYKVSIKGATSAAKAEPSPPRQATSVSKSQSAPPPAPQGASDEPDDVTEIADGLSLIVRSVETGYKLFASNTHATSSFSVTVNFAESSNLTFAAVGPAKAMDDGSKISFSIRSNAGQVHVADCNVKDYSLGSCDIRYKVAARQEA